MLSSAFRLALFMAAVAAVFSLGSAKKFAYHTCRPIASTIHFANRFQFTCRIAAKIDGDTIAYFIVPNTDPHKVNQAQQIVNMAMVFRRNIRVMPYIERIKNAKQFDLTKAQAAASRVIAGVELL